MTPATLSELRSGLTGLTLLVWSDIRSGTVLAADGDLIYPQEYLDALSICAAQVLTLPGPKAGVPAECGLFHGPTVGRLFLRDAHVPDHAFSGLCAAAADGALLLRQLSGRLADRPMEGVA